VNQWCSTSGRPGSRAMSAISHARRSGRSDVVSVSQKTMRAGASAVIVSSRWRRAGRPGRGRVRAGAAGRGRSGNARRAGPCTACTPSPPIWGGPQAAGRSQGHRRAAIRRPHGGGAVPVLPVADGGKAVTGAALEGGGGGQGQGGGRLGGGPVGRPPPDWTPAAHRRRSAS